LTAIIERGGYSDTKTIDYIVMEDIDDWSVVQKDHEYLTYSTLTSEYRDNLTMSLNLPCKGAYGSQIKWRSDNTNVLLDNGRVIRPKVGKPDEQVSLTAEITFGTATVNRYFYFTVKMEDELLDPQVMSDDKLFGVWDKEAKKWIEKGKLDYGYSSAMSIIERAAKDGDYVLPRRAL
jgi:hypothetical protein